MDLYERYAFGPSKTKDGSARDPIGTIGRVRDTLHRARSAQAAPDWFNGTIEEYRAQLAAEVLKSFPALKPEIEGAVVVEPAAYDYFSFDGKPFGAEKKGNRFRKDVIRVGEFHHPKQSDPVAMTRPRVENFVANTNELIRQKVKIPATLRHNKSPEAGVGFWEPLSVNADGEVISHLRVEDETIVPKIGKGIQDVSIGLARNVKAPDGRILDESIDHIALTLFPVDVNGKNFEPAFLGLDRDSGPALYVAKPEKPTVDPLAKIKAKLNLSADATEDEVEEALSKFEKSESEKADLQKKLDAKDADLLDRDTRLGRLEATNFDHEVKESFESDLINDRQKPYFRGLLATPKDGKVTVLDKQMTVADAVRKLVKEATPVTFDLSRRMSKATEPTELDKSEIAEANRQTHIDAEVLAKTYPDRKLEWSKDSDGRESFELVERV